MDTPCPTPPAPALSSPPDGSTTGDDTPTIAWTSASGATSYRIQVDDDAGFSSPQVDLSTSSTTYTPGSALADGTYHWRVRASNACGGSPWSVARSLTVDTPCPTPPAPALSSPPDGSTTGDDTPTFAWASASGATS